MGYSFVCVSINLNRLNRNFCREIKQLYCNQKIFPVIGFILCLLGSFSDEAVAHAKWSIDGDFQPRDNVDDIKNPEDPRASDYCGRERSSNTAEFEAGSIVAFNWEARIYHAGYFRIALSEADDSNFDDHILLDNYREIENTSNYTYEVELPDIECDACTLQLIQVMEDREPPTNYYSCADIQLVRSEDVQEPVNNENDTVPPNRVDNLVVTDDFRLTWENPAADFYRVLILRSERIADRSLPEDGENYVLGDSLADAEVIYIGSNDQYYDRRADRNLRYRYDVYAFDKSLNYSIGRYVNTELPAIEQYPDFSFLIEQDMESGPLVDVDGGLVNVQVIDNNSQSFTRYVWSQIDGIEDEDVNDATFSFSPNRLALNNYIFEAEVTNSQGLTTVKQISISVDENIITPSVMVIMRQGDNTGTTFDLGGQEVEVDLVIDTMGNAKPYTIQWRQIMGEGLEFDINTDDSFLINTRNLEEGRYSVELIINQEGSRSYREIMTLDFQGATGTPDPVSPDNANAQSANSGGGIVTHFVISLMLIYCMLNILLSHSRRKSLGLTVVRY